MVMTMNQRRLLPSTSMLAAFDAAARAGSFSAAARELNLTQGAVSRQIRALEQQLGVKLFVRERQTVSLTDVGRTYAQEIEKALGAIRSASLNAVTDPLGGVLNLAILPTFGTRWLIPRLPGFLREHPGITVNLFTKMSPFDIEQEGLHAAIHYGSPNWPAADCTYLMDEEVIPVCSPRFLGEHRLEKAEDFLSVPLLHITTRPDAWSEWFEFCGVSRHAYQGMRFEQLSSAAQAAIAGLGAALLPTFLIRSELENRSLAPAIERPMKSRSAYHLAVPEGKTGYAPVSAFRGWLLQAVRDYYQR